MKLNVDQVMSELANWQLRETKTATAREELERREAELEAKARRERVQ